MKVLLVKTSSMGDVIHALPAVTDAQRAHPGMVLDWVVEEGFAEIPAWHPAVHSVIPVAIRRWRKSPWQAVRSGDWARFRERLNAQRYDAVIDAQGLIKSALLSRLVKNAPRYGYSRDTVREPLASCAYQHRITVARDQHAIERIRQLFAASLGYALPQTEVDYGLSRAAFVDDSAQHPLVFLHGTARVEKCWPESHWIALGQAMARAGHRIALPWGNAEEQQRAERIASAIGVAATVLPKLNLQGVARVIAAARAVVAVDTGLGHLSAALGVPCLSLYGPTDPAWIGARGAHQQFVCAADATMASLSPVAVESALRALLGDAP
jgi:heptosyltransferase-1